MARTPAEYHEQEEHFSGRCVTCGNPCLQCAVAAERARVLALAVQIGRLSVRAEAQLRAAVEGEPDAAGEARP